MNRAQRGSASSKIIAGTKGTFRDYPPRIFLDDDGSAREGTPHGDWQSLDALRAEFEHPLWTLLAERAVDGGHEGIDFVMNYRLIECLREGLVPDIDVYDAAAWSAAGPLSELSVAQGSSPVEFPDFTRGAWRGTPAQS